MSLVVLRQASRALLRKPRLAHTLRPYARSLATAADQPTDAAGEKPARSRNSTPQPKSTPTHFNLTATPHPVPDQMGHRKSKTTEKHLSKDYATDTHKDTDTRTHAHTQAATTVTAVEHAMGPSVWTKEEINAVRVTHRPADDLTSRMAYGVVCFLRTAFDIVSGYKLVKQPSAEMYLNRIIFLETSAGVPGMVAAMLRHFRSLRSMHRDHGWIHTLLEEAENERMHLMTFAKVKQPRLLFRTAVVVLQGVMANALFFAYIVKPSFVHRFVGYLEEEAVKTYTTIIDDVESGKVPEMAKFPVPDIAKDYWRLGDDVTFLDLLKMVRADEANHRVVNHTLASLEQDADNPFSNAHGKVVIPPEVQERERQQHREERAA